MPQIWKFSLGWIVCSSTMIQLWANDFRNRIRHQSTGCSYVRSNTLFWEVNIFEHVRVDRKGEGSNLVSRCGPKYQCDWRQPRMHTIRIWLNCALSTSCGPVKKQPESQQVLTSPISHSIKVGKLWERDADGARWSHQHFGEPVVSAGLFSFCCHQLFWPKGLMLFRMTIYVHAHTCA